MPMAPGVCPGVHTNQRLWRVLVPPYCLDWFYTELPDLFKGVRHDTHGTGTPLWIFCALEELSEINWRIPSSSHSPRSVAGKINLRGGLNLAVPCHAPCSHWQVQLGSDLLSSSAFLSSEQQSLKILAVASPQSSWHNPSPLGPWKVSLAKPGPGF